MNHGTDVGDGDLRVVFSLTEGGPGSSIIRRLRLVHPELGTGATQTALILVLLTWVLLFILSLLRGFAFSGVKVPFLPVLPGDFIAMVLPGLLPALPLAATVMPVGDILSRMLRLVL